MASILDFFNGSATPEQNAGLLGFATQILGASNGRQPVNFGQVLAAGAQGFQQGRQQHVDREQAQAQAQQLAAMRALQTRAAQNDVDAQERGSALQARIEESARAAAQGGQFDAAAFVNDVRSYDPLTAAKYEQQFAKAAPKFDSGITFVNGPDGKPVAVRTADDGSIKTIDGLAPREKAELVNLGGKSMAINPFAVQPGQTFDRTATPDAMLQANVTMRGQNMTDSRARDLNAISQETNAIKRGEKQREADLGKAGQVASFDTMLGTLDRLKSHPGLSRSTGLVGKLPTIPGSESANFQAELETFKSQAFVPMVAQLKGMGALSDAEGRKLTAAVGALDPNMSEGAFRASINRVITEMDAARKRVVQSASPELQRSLAAPAAGAAQPQQAAQRAPMKGQVVDGYRFKGGNPADPNNWERK